MPRLITSKEKIHLSCTLKLYFKLDLGLCKMYILRRYLTHTFPETQLHVTVTRTAATATSQLGSTN